VGKRMCPKGTTRRVPCPKCGRLFYRFFQGNKLRKFCTVCDPPKEERK